MRAKRDAISKMTLMTDIFFEAFAEDVNAIQEMLRVILKDDLKSCHMQLSSTFQDSIRLAMVY